LGFRAEGLVPASTIPLALTVILFSGPVSMLVPIL
jgi:hypothetical protein